MIKPNNKKITGARGGGIMGMAAGALAQNKKPNTISAYNTVQAAKKLEQDADLEIENVRGLIGTGLRGSDETISAARKRAGYMNATAKRYRSLANAAVKKSTGRDYPLASSPSFGD